MMNYKKYLFFFCLLGLIVLCDAKVLVITHNYNRPDFIQIQHDSFKKFLADDYEYVVFNDATDPDLFRKITQMCGHLNVRCINIPQENRTKPNTVIDMSKYIFWAGLRHAEAILFSLNALGFDHAGLVMMIDSDMFLIKKFSPTEFMEGYDIAGLEQVRGFSHFLWAGLMFFRMNTLPDKHEMQFKGGLAGDVPFDTGGSLHYYLAAHPNIKIKYFEQDFRLFLDGKLKPYAIHNKLLTKFDDPFFSPNCKQCQSTNSSCIHSQAILRELGISEQIINLIQAKNFIPEIEFVMGDTFLHYQAVSNYSKKSKLFLAKKSRKLNEFISMVLN